jgi:hypothetical protein
LIQDLSTSSKESEEIDKKKVKLFDAEETKRRKKYLLKMMNATSSNTNLVHDKEADSPKKVGTVFLHNVDVNEIGLSPANADIKQNCVQAERKIFGG